MSKAEEVLKQGIPQQAQVNYDMSNYMKNYNDTLNNYQQTSNNALNNYKQTYNQNLGVLKQQTQQQINFLTQQLNASKQKYQLENQQQQAVINQQYKEANNQIDQQAFENYKMSNQNGMLRGVSNSMQQQAMDNSVAQQTAGLFNQNLTNKNNSLNELKNKLSSQMLDLDMQYASDVNNVRMNQFNKQMELQNAMSEKEFAFVTQQADKIMQLQMANNELQFNTEKEKEQYRAELAMKLYDMQFSNAQAIDDRAFQASEAQKDRDFQASENAKDRALQQYTASLRGSGGSGGSSSKTEGAEFTEDEIIYQEQLAYYVNAKGCDYLTAMELAKKDVEYYMNKKKNAFANAGSKSSNKNTSQLNTIQKRVANIMDKTKNGGGVFNTLQGTSNLTREQFTKMMGIN